MKVMLVAIFDCQGIVQHGYASEGQTINKEFTEMISIVFIMQFDTRDQICGPQGTGNSIITTLQPIQDT